MSQASTIERIQKHAAKIANGEHEKIKPGAPVQLSEAASVGDAIRQGDLYLEVIAKVPSSHKVVKSPSDLDRQLVPGNTQGAKHCLDSLDGVKLYRPKDWPEISGLVGPCLVLTEERTVMHPTHGHVVIAAGQTVLCSYQREWDAESRKARRNAD